MHDSPKILVVDSDIHLGKFLKRQLGHKNYDVDFNTNGKDASDELLRNHYDLLILELNLPGMDGLDLLKKIHAANPRLPILVLSDRNRTDDIVRGLDAGADMYMKKPFSFMEMAARVQALLKRNYGTPSATANTACGLTIDRDGHRAFRGQRTIDLTQREFEILDYLMNNVGRALSRKALMEDVWRVAYDPATNIVDVYMKYLRDKIDLDGEPKLIRTIRGVGYALTNEDELPPKKDLGEATMSRFEAATAIGSTCAA
jgi:DNA-binding response OmpR family regulator